MLARCNTYVLDGIEARPVTVECDIRSGLPSFSIIGLPDSAARELRETLRVAIQNTGYQFPERRTTLNIAPASLRRNSPSIALAAALAVLAASGQLEPAQTADVAVYGELTVNGAIRPLSGTLAAAYAHRRNRDASLFLHAGETLPREFEPAHSAPLEQLSDIPTVPRATHRESATLSPARHSVAPDFADVRGHDAAIFALTVAAAGGHHVLLRGPSGSGKTMLARRLPGILPGLAPEQADQVATIRDSVGLHPDRHRPFRAPHHTISAAGLVGGGAPVRPGEVTLASGGVLFLDQVSEFSRAALEALRAPMQDGQVTIVRGQTAHRFPSSFQLLAADLPCPCGHAGSSSCTCDPATLDRYRRRLSAPLLDRISIVIDLPANPDFSHAPAAPSSQTLRDRVITAAERQAHRASVLHSNSPWNLVASTGLSEGAESALDFAYRSGALSVRGQMRVLQVARTVADLDGASTITRSAVETALKLRGVELLTPAGR